jgi:hypothetical protein
MNNVVRIIVKAPTEDDRFWYAREIVEIDRDACTRDVWKSCWRQARELRASHSDLICEVEDPCRPMKGVSEVQILRRIYDDYQLAKKNFWESVQYMKGQRT